MVFHAEETAVDSSDSHSRVDMQLFTASITRAVISETAHYLFSLNTDG